MARFGSYDIGVLLLLLLLLSVAGVSADIASDSYNYMLLIEDVHNYYGTTCIIIVRSNQCTDMNETTVTQIWTRSFSRSGILTVIVGFSDLAQETKKYEGCEVRPLYVVLLSTKKTLNEFAAATGRIDISFPVWFVMFLPHQGDPLKSDCRSPTGNLFNLSFDTEMLVLCYDQPSLREWYSFRDNRTTVSNLAVWKPGQGLWPVTNGSLYARRNNLRKEIMRIAYVEVSAFVAVENGVLTKYLGEVIQELSESLNFTIEVTNPMDSYGNLNEETQTWSGVIGELVADTVDIGVAEFSMTKRRLEVVDFTLPLILSRMRVYFKKPDGSSVRWTAYVKVSRCCFKSPPSVNAITTPMFLCAQEFDRHVWTGIAFTVFAVPIVLTLMKTRGRLFAKVVGEYYINVWGIYCQQGMPEFPQETSQRLAFVSIFVSALIIASAYSASLISNLTVSTVSLPFSTLEQFAHDGSYKLIVFRDSADYDTIVSGNDSVSFRLQKLLKKKDYLPLSVTDGFRQVCTEKVGFYVTEAIVSSLSRMPCAIEYIEANRIESLAIVLNKRSPYRQVINYKLQRLKDNGVINKLRNMYLLPTNDYQQGYPVVTLGSVTPLLAIVVCGVVVGCLILTLEKMCYRCCDKESRCETIRKKLRRNPSRRGGARRYARSPVGYAHRDNGDRSLR
nr:glutamate receptor ionotropic, delta-2-like isoform X1 [Megalopta genalis]